MKYLLALLSLVLITAPSFSCLNEYNVDEKGEVNEMYGGLPVFYRSFNLEQSRSIVDPVDLRQKQKWKKSYLNSVGVHLAQLGEYEKSLELFLWLNEKHPNEYQIIANLGTLYELNGEVDSAYKYIEKGMELNPDSHFGSEWVHLAILKAKINMAKNPKWIYNHKVLNLGLDDSKDYYQTSEELVIDTIRHISYQLEERIPFTPDRDIILANILNELGDMLRIHLSIENAYVSYRMALHYDPEDHYGVQKKIEALKPLMKENEIDESVFEEHFPPKGEHGGKQYMEQDTSWEEDLHKQTNNTIWIVGGIIAGTLILFLIAFFWLRKRTK